MAILLVNAALRMYQITAPPVDFQSWRATATLMVARNFYRDGLNPFFPRVDWFHSQVPPGSQVIAGTEFMAVPFLTALLYHVFGEYNWVGRLVPILFSLLGLYFFYRLANRIYGEKAAAAATILLGVMPYYLYCGRSAMPESFAIGMACGALLYYEEWLERRSAAVFALAWVCTVLMLVGKPQLGVLVVAFAYLTFRHLRTKAFQDRGVYAFLFATATPTLAYAYWSWFVLGRITSISWGDGSMHFAHARWLSDLSYYQQIAMSIWRWSATPLVCILGGIGAAVSMARRSGFALAWLASAGLLFVVMPGACQTNGYYQIILEPPLALLAAIAFAGMSTYKWPRIIAGVAVAGAVGNCLYVAAAMYRPDYEQLRDCGEWIRENTPEDSRVLVAEQSSTTLYFADRSGWASWPKSHNVQPVFDAGFIQQTRDWGATVIAIPHAWFDDGNYRDFDVLRDSLYDTFRCIKEPNFSVFLMELPADLTLPTDGLVQFGLPSARKYLRGTWGPDRISSKGWSFTSLGPGNAAQIRFVTTGAREIRLLVSSPLQNQTLRYFVNESHGGTFLIDQANSNVKLSIDKLPLLSADGVYTITLHVTKQDAGRVGLFLHQLELIRF
ncbi:MAG TPA: glycosyltransferase family 39 protein [Candidatus Hydrogenedentes bacterium]|nr:glycosyltransferase family 39 protein [Candidatus Hydrogenedentota bacterium]